MKVRDQDVLNARREAAEARREVESLVQFLWLQHEQLVVSRDLEFVAREIMLRLRTDLEAAEAEIARRGVADDGAVVDVNMSTGVGTRESPFLMEDEMEDGTENHPFELD